MKTVKSFLDFLSELWQRIVSPTPAFHKKMQRVWATLIGVAFFILMSPDWFPKWMTDVAPYVLVAGLIGGGQAQLTVHDPAKLLEMKNKFKSGAPSDFTESTGPAPGGPEHPL